MRLSDIDESAFTDPEEQAIVARIKQRRGSSGLLALDKALLHCPPVADGWNTFLGAIRTQTTLPAAVREAIICRVAALNRAWYEWIQHIDLLLQALPRPRTGDHDDGDGATSSSSSSSTEQTVVSRDFVRAIFSSRAGAWLQSHRGVNGHKRDAAAPDERFAAAMAFTDALTLEASVSDDIYPWVRGHFSEREVAEIAATCAAYNCVSRFLNALHVGDCAGEQGMRQAIDFTAWLDQDARPPTLE